MEEQKAKSNNFLKSENLTSSSHTILSSGNLPKKLKIDNDSAEATSTFVISTQNEEAFNKLASK